MDLSNLFGFGASNGVSPMPTAEIDLFKPEAAAPTAVGAPVVQESGGFGGFLSGATDFLSSGLNLYGQFSAIEAAKDAQGQGQEELDRTVEVQTPQVVQTMAPTERGQQMYNNALGGLQFGTGTILGIIGLIGFLWWMTNKK